MIHKIPILIDSKPPEDQNDVVVLASVVLFVGALILANFIVYWLGPWGLTITAVGIIPFDLVIRCFLHETWKGNKLVLRLAMLILAASGMSYLLNPEIKQIAIASSAGFIAAQITAGVYYQLMFSHKYLIKVNGSDLVAILVDSVVFQLIAFAVVDYYVMASQFFLKAIGGLIWYFIIFEKLKLQERWK